MENHAGRMLGVIDTRRDGVRLMRQAADRRVARISLTLRLARIGEISPASAAKVLRGDIERNARAVRVLTDAEAPAAMHVAGRRAHAQRLMFHVAASSRYVTPMRAAARGAYGRFALSAGRWLIADAPPALSPSGSGRPSGTGIDSQMTKPTSPDTSPNTYWEHPA